MVPRTIRTPVAAAAWCALALVACGSARTGSRPCSPAPTQRPPEVSEATVTAVADRAVVAPGGTVTFTVVASGVSRFNAPCSGPLHVVIDDASQAGVYSTSSASGPSSPCGAVALAAGGRAVYSVAWPVDPTLPGGPYEATLVLGDTPAIQLPIAVGAVKPSC
jgi:hypothetical protein